MSLLSKIISATYPFRMKLAKYTGMGIQKNENTDNTMAPISFYTLEATLSTGEKISMENYRGKKILIVNLASQCGYTPQYESLELLHQNNKQIAVLGFPSNNFGGQEPGSDKEIGEFCKLNFGVTFPLFKKDDVKGTKKQSVYAWLSGKDKNGWNDKEPQWNFYKYLVDENGNLSKVLSSSVSPEDISC